ncbi:MarR family winged helix-turn-helix transcriptional regulator [Microbulbifer sp. CnH-101-E]|uniref:MarR family transcriptional regulator n=1 Tax=Microbulbifer variabilis TaxID=266805 RepID=A0ABY4VD00_9GAMM|nr:MarR family transcriptional regulator [Microbulbifer variabilis]USD22180.1 MarR family transcriptional regulator [Microbulbifer variabilis]
MICDEDSELALNRQLCFALYAASRAMTKAYQPMLQDLGITYPQYLVLMVLWEWAREDENCEVEKDGKDNERSLGALGQRLMLDSGTLTPLLKRMQEHGLVERKRAPWDERVTLVAATSAGLALKPRAKQWVQQNIQNSAITRTEVKQLHGDLWQFLNKLEGSNPIGTAK